MNKIDLIIDALLVAESSVWSAKIAEALVAARKLQALKPVAWIGNADFVTGQFVEGRVRRVWWECNTGVGQPLYFAPPRKPWVGLTDEEILDLWVANHKDTGATDAFAHAIETRLKELNT